MKTNYKLTTDQEKALEILNTGANVFLSGEAGTGKSYLLHKYIKECNKKAIVCAPTGIAAVNIGGSTLHRMFKIPIRPLGPGEFSTSIRKSVVHADIIIIDEISMCRFDVFEYVMATIRRVSKKKHKKQIIVCGDFFQLQPVLPDNEKFVLQSMWKDKFCPGGFAFQSDAWANANFKPVILKTVVRQTNDVEFQKHLNEIRCGDISALNWFNNTASRIRNKNAIYICGINRLADTINNEQSAKLTTTEKIFKATAVGTVNENDKVAPEVLVLKLGMRVMSLINDEEGKYQNGSLGTITWFTDDGEVAIKFDNGCEAIISTYTWKIIVYDFENGVITEKAIGAYSQLPLKIAYAITIHKSQGQTYDAVNVYPNCFADGQLYVALSRARQISTMSLTEDIQPQWLKTSPIVRQFYKKLEDQT